MSLDFNFAPIDVLIIIHDKVNKIPTAKRHAALGLWLWGHCFSRLNKTNGRLSMESVRSSLGANGEPLARHLLNVGLWLPIEGSGDVMIFNWEKKGAGRRVDASKSTDRVRRHREGKRMKRDETQSETPCNAFHETVGNAFHETETSPSSSDLISSSPPDESPSGDVRPCPEPEPERSPDGPWPAWFDDVLGTLATQVEPIGDPAAAWVRYEGHRATKNKPMTGPDARYWLTTVVIPEQRAARAKAADERERRDALERRQRVDQDRRDGLAPYHREAEVVPELPPEQRVSPEEARQMLAAVGLGS